jgi:hypothetical protein
MHELEVLCRCHHQQGVNQWLKQHFAIAEERQTRKPMMKHVFQTQDKRTVRRRLARLKKRAAALGIIPWVTRADRKGRPSREGEYNAVCDL